MGQKPPDIDLCVLFALSQTEDTGILDIENIQEKMTSIEIQQYGTDLVQIPVKSLSSRYHLISNLGSGSFGIVALYKVKNGVLNGLMEEMVNFPGTLLSPSSINYKYSNDLVAIKTMNKKLKKLTDYSKVKEIQFIFSVDSHFNLVQIIDVFIDRTYLKLNIVMENMDQNLYQLMKMRKGNVFSPRTLKSILSQLLSAILHIHKHLFFHRDVKPENILVMQNLNFFGSRQNIPLNQRNNSYIIKLADYGLARHSRNDKPFTAYVSTRWYRSPEILLRQGFYSFPVDIWAFGCVAMECATFCPLFPGANELDQCCKIMEFLGNPNKSFQLSALQNSNYSYNSYKSNTNSGNYHYGPMVPFGGFWDDAKDLALKLGLVFPKNFGYRLENVVIRKDFSLHEKNDFFQMVKSCLTWDPNKRATAFSLVHSPYFEDSMSFIKNQKENEITIDPMIVNTNSNVTDAAPINTHKNISKNDSNVKRSMIFAGIPTTNIATNNNRNGPTVSSSYLFRNRADSNMKQFESKGDSPVVSQKINLSHPGLGMKNKFDMINTTNLLKSFNNQPLSENYSNTDQVALVEPDNSMMQLASDPIEDYVTIFPHDANISELRNNNSNSYDLISSRLENMDSIYDENNNARKEDRFKELDLTHIDQILNEEDSENENIKHGKPINIKYDLGGNSRPLNDVDQDDDHVKEVEAFENENEGEDVNDDVDEDEDEEEDEEDEETENELLSLELGKVSLYLQDPNTHMKPADSEISINNSTNQGNYDLIDEINYALDDEYQIKHINLYSWDGHS